MCFIVPSLGDSGLLDFPKACKRRKTLEAFCFNQPRGGVPVETSLSSETHRQKWSSSRAGR